MLYITAVPIFTLLKKSVDTANKLCTPKVLICFISEQSRNLSVRLSDYDHRSHVPEPVPLWTRDRVDFVFDLINQKCEVNILSV
jgi:hypothetical protein